MTTPPRKAWNAGHLPGEPAHGLAAAAIPHPQVDPNSVVKLADISEFQPNVHPSYLKWSQAVIVRAAYGDQHDDHAWYGGARRDFFHANGARYLGFYQYIVANQPIIPQAKAFCRLIGTMRKGEDLFADIEEGSGNLQQRWQQWANVVHSELGWAPSSYSGLYFARDHGLQPVKWVAAYGQTEPSVPHEFWQFSSSYPIPGVGTGDCSLWHGNIGDLAAIAYGGDVVVHPDKPPQTNWTEKLMQNLPTLGQGMTGPDVKTLQGALIARGYDKVKADGIFGADTKAALKSFQTSRHLTSDGVAGPATWPKLLNR